MDTKKYSDVQVLEDAINTLGNLRIPVDQTMELALPINRVRSNLIAIVQVILENQEKAQQAASQAQEGENDEGTLGGDGSDGLSGGDGSEHPEGE